MPWQDSFPPQAFQLGDARTRQESMQDHVPAGRGSARSVSSPRRSGAALGLRIAIGHQRRYTFVKTGLAQTQRATAARGQGGSRPRRRRHFHEEPRQTTDVPFVEPAPRTHRSLCNSRGLVKGQTARCPRLDTHSFRHLSIGPSAPAGKGPRKQHRPLCTPLHQGAPPDPAGAYIRIGSNVSFPALDLTRHDRAQQRRRRAACGYESPQSNSASHKWLPIKHHNPTKHGVRPTSRTGSGPRRARSVTTVETLDRAQIQRHSRCPSPAPGITPRIIMIVVMIPTHDRPKPPTPPPRASDNPGSHPPPSDRRSSLWLWSTACWGFRRGLRPSAPGTPRCLLADLVLQRQQLIVPAALHLFGNIIRPQLIRLRPGPRAVLEDGAVLEPELPDNVHALLERLFGLAAEPDNEVARDRRPRHRFANARHRVPVIRHGVPRFIRLQHFVAADWRRDVQVPRRPSAGRGSPGAGRPSCPSGNS